MSGNFQRFWFRSARELTKSRDTVYFLKSRKRSSLERAWAVDLWSQSQLCWWPHYNPHFVSCLVLNLGQLVTIQTKNESENQPETEWYQRLISSFTCRWPDFGPVTWFERYLCNVEMIIRNHDYYWENMFLDFGLLFHYETSKAR